MREYGGGQCDEVALSMSIVFEEKTKEKDLDIQHFYGAINTMNR